MEYKRKLFTLNVTIAEQLEKEKNQSAVVAEALERYFEGRDGARAMAKLVQENTQVIDGLGDEVMELRKTVQAIAAFMRSQGADL